MNDHSDRWAAGSNYEDFMGRWSRVLARSFVVWLDVPRRGRWLDVGCGTGALSHAICELADPVSVVGCDPSAPFIDFAVSHVRDDRATFVVAGAGNLPPHGEGYSGIASLLALNFIPDPVAAVKEMGALGARGATIAACVWDYAGKMEMLRRFWDAARAIDPRAESLDEGARFPLCRPAALESLFREAGLDGVSCEAIEIPTTFDGFEDYWRPFLGGTGPAPAFVASLDERARGALREALERAVRPDAGGEVRLIARAWAVRGTCAR